VKLDGMFVIHMDAAMSSGNGVTYRQAS
jgi:hypothetical protein